MGRGDLSTDLEVAREQHRRHDPRWLCLRAVIGVATVIGTAGWVVARWNDPSAGLGLAGSDGPSWYAVVGWASALVGLYAVVFGPQPWRATRWGWFWLLGLPFGGVGFAVLSGPTPRLAAPRDPFRRMSGGRAFLISLVVCGVSYLLF